MGYNAINIKNSYKHLEIRSSRDFMIYEKEFHAVKYMR